MKRKTKFPEIWFAVTLLLLAFIILFRKAEFRLEFKEQISIFLLGADRISWYLSNPALLVSIVGDWLTQFYANGRYGALFSALLMTLALLGLVRFFKLSEPEKPACWMLLVLPVMLEGYFIPFPNYPVSATLGLVVAIWTSCLLAHIKDYRYSLWIYGLSVPVMFVFAGGHALTLALLLGFLKRKEGLSSILTLLAGVVLMLMAGRFYNLTLLHTLLWPVVPDYIIPNTDILLAQPWFILLVLILSLHYGKVMFSAWISFAFSFLFIFTIPIFRWNVIDEMEDVVKIGTLAYHEQWKEVKEMAEKPGRYSAFYYNLCNAREGRLPDKLLDGEWGKSSDILFLSTGRGDPYFSMIYYTDALLEMGDLSQATDCALLAQTVMPGHYSTRMLRRLAEISVVAGDGEVALKYLDILSRTRNHKAWAEDLTKCILKDSIPQKYLILHSRTCDEDHFFTQGDIRASLKIITDESPLNKTAIDYLLCSYLLEKNLGTFISLYDKYYLNGLDRYVTVSDLYQEALLVNVNSGESLRETVQKYHLSEKVVNKYIAFLEAQSGSADEQGIVFSKDWEGTYWHYIMKVKF